MKALPVNPLAATGKAGSSAGFVILVLAAFAILAKKQFQSQNSR